MYDRNTQPLMIRTTHAVKIDHQICEMRVSGGFPSMQRTRLRFIIGSTARITTDAPNAPAKFRTVGQAEPSRGRGPDRPADRSQAIEIKSDSLE
jgi:hypothetical protein